MAPTCVFAAQDWFSGVEVFFVFRGFQGVSGGFCRGNVVPIARPKFDVPAGYVAPVYVPPFITPVPMLPCNICCRAT